MLLDWETPADASRVLRIPSNLLVATSERKSTAPSFLERLLQAAQADAHNSAMLASERIKPEEQPTKLILASQQHFVACLHQAEYTAMSLAGLSTEFDASAWRKRIGTLKDQNASRAKEGRYERQRELAEKAKSTAATATPFREADGEGIPWTIEPGQSAPHLQSAQDEWHEESRSHTAWLLLVAIFLLILTYVRHGVSLASVAAPEIVLALILVYFWYEGINVIGIAASMLMLSIRCLRVIGVWRRTRTPKQTSNTDVAANVTKFQQTPPIAPRNE
jgi:hypothetical protein